jgi:DNA processing protein
MKYAYWLSSIIEVGGGKFSFLSQNGYSAYEIYGMSQERLMSLDGITPQDAAAIELSKRSWNLDAEWMKLMEKGIGFVSMEDDHYPRRLRHIPGAPFSL